MNQLIRAGGRCWVQLMQVGPTFNEASTPVALKKIGYYVHTLQPILQRYCRWTLFYYHQTWIRPNKPQVDYPQLPTPCKWCVRVKVCETRALSDYSDTMTSEAGHFQRF